MNEKKMIRELSELLNTNTDSIPNAVKKLKTETKELEKRLRQ